MERGRPLRCEEGITLIELIVVIAILAVALAGVYALLFWGYNTFFSGTDKTKLHHQLNMASEIITGEMRYATEMALLKEGVDLPNGPVEVAPGEHYLFYDEENEAVVLLDNESRREIGAPLIHQVSFYLEGDDLFHFDLEAKQKENIFTLESSVLLLNNPIPTLPAEPPADGRYSRVRYRKP